MSPAGGRRRDARENKERVIDAAMALLTANPDASMQEIANRSGLGRTTVYRHFPSREKLFEAMILEVLQRSSAEVFAVTRHGRPAAETLREIGRLNIELGIRYRFLYENRDLTMRPIQSRTREGDSAVESYLQDAQQRGEIREDMPTWWMTALALSLTMAMVSDVLADRIDRDEAGIALGETLVSAITRPG